MNQPTDAHLEALQQQTRSVYQRHAAAWDHQRSQHQMEQKWLDRAQSHVQPPGPVLDVGCGTGAPIAAYFIERNYSIVGVDFAPAMLDVARRRWPEHWWLEVDMRTLALDQVFGAVVAWNSFFHLNAEEQRRVLPLLSAHVAPGGILLLTIGDRAGEVVGTVMGDAVYHASLHPDEYRA
ncbi:MAG: class I SAM-dependent methyltransferase, partial [Myxococcota bacterium]